MKCTLTISRVARQIGVPIVTLLLGLVAPPVVATESLATVTTSTVEVSFSPQISHSHVRVTVSGPQGFQAIATFNSGEIPRINLPGLDGLYKYELRFGQSPSREAAGAMAAFRASGTNPFLDRTATAKAAVQSGTFRIVGGAVVREEVEPNLKSGQRGFLKNVLTNSDGVIRNSLCVGVDCPDAPSFGDSTIVLMENNTRIKFADTSTTSSFPASDWEIEANSSVNGGTNYLGFTDCGTGSNSGGCSGTLVFAVEAGARANALYVESDGDVGIGTSNPVVDLHMVTGNTPTVRLDQDGSSGFTPQVWDVAGNETNFFIRDATHGSALPFRIRPGAPSNSIFVDTDGRIGLGTAAPETNARLHVKTNVSTGAVDNILLENTTGPARIKLRNAAITNSATQDSDWVLNSNGTFRISAGLDAAEFVLDAAGGLTIQGTLTENSSVLAKQNFSPIDSGDMLQRVLDLPITTWTYKSNPEVRQIGPMAQDFFAAFGLGGTETGIAPRNLSAVAIAAIQGLHQKLVAKDEKIAKLERSLTDVRGVQKKLAAREKTISKLEGRLADIEAMLRKR